MRGCVIRYFPRNQVRGESFVMLPMPSDLCFSDEGGQNWPLRFHRDTCRGCPSEGRIVAVTIDGLGLWPATLQLRSSWGGSCPS